MIRNYLFITLAILVFACEENNVMDQGIVDPAFSTEPQTICGEELSYARFPDDAIDVAANETYIFKVAVNRVVYAYNREDDSWVSLGGQARRITVDGANNIWITNHDNEIYRCTFFSNYTRTDWEKMSGKATDIGASSLGVVYILGDREIGKEYDVYRRTATGWNKIGGRGRRIAAGNSADAWLINKNNKIYRLSGNQWTKISGEARDIAEGGGNTQGLYIVGNTENSGDDGYEVYSYDYSDETWCKVRGIGTNITVKGGLPIVSNSRNEMYGGCLRGAAGTLACAFD
ncbi:MAG: tectonin domain-containing protein [Bacteroidota bacterium]